MSLLERALPQCKHAVDHAPLSAIWIANIITTSLNPVCRNQPVTASLYRARAEVASLGNCMYSDRRRVVFARCGTQANEKIEHYFVARIKFTGTPLFDLRSCLEIPE